MSACSTATPQNSEPAPNSATPEIATVQQDSTKETRNVDIPGLTWADGSPITASKISVTDAKPATAKEITSKRTHKLPDGEVFLGVLEDGRPVVLRENLPYTVDESGKYSQFWPKENTSLTNEDSSWAIQGNTVLALTPKNVESDQQTFATYNESDGVKDFGNLGDILGTASDLVVNGDKVYWAEVNEETSKVLSKGISDTDRKVEAKEAAAVYRTADGIAVLKRKDHLPLEEINQIQGVELLNGTRLLNADSDFELSGFSGDVANPSPEMNGGSIISFEVAQKGEGFDMAVLNIETQKAWIVELPKDSIPFGKATSNSQAFIAWSPEKMEELGELGNEAVVLNPSTGNLSALNSTTDLDALFSNDKALGWTTKDKSGSVSFTTGTLK